jgi:hypothetical protein
LFGVDDDADVAAPDYQVARLGLAYAREVWAADVQFA